MTFDDLRSHWHEISRESVMHEQLEQRIALVCRKTERFEAGIIRRDWIETFAAVFSVVGFGQALLFVKQPIARIGAGIIILAVIFIIYKLHWTRRRDKPAPLDSSIRDFCQIELQRIDRQIRLLRTMLWWYIAPGLIGVNVFFSGVQGINLASIGYGIATVLFGWFIYVLNQRAVNKSILPQRHELAGLLDDLGEPPAAHAPVQRGDIG
jgi:hypothetical protein